MTDAFAFVKHLGSLRPAEDRAQALLNDLPNGAEVLVTVKRPRNIRHHRKLFALLQVVQPNTDYPTVDALLVALKVYLGHCDVMQTKGGKPVAVPRSISFASMGQDEFSKFYDGVVDAVVEHFLPGVTREDLAREVEDLIGMRGAA